MPRNFPDNLRKAQEVLINLKAYSHCMKDSYETLRDESRQWEAKVQDLEGLVHQDQDTTRHILQESMLWYRKCIQVIDFSNDLVMDMPLKLRDAFNDMTPNNTPPIVFDFIIFCRITIRDLQAELKPLKKAQADDNG